VILVIGYGNSLRQDDGAGLILAELIEQACRLCHLPAKRICVHQLVPELARELARDEVEVVIFADTRVAPTPQETSHAVQISPLIVDTSSPSVGHHLTPATLLVYAKMLYGKRPPAWIATIPGFQFEYGEDFSQSTQDALDAAKTVVAHWLTERTSLIT
jgi:hydrogenase maturation protease